MVTLLDNMQKKNCDLNTSLTRHAVLVLWHQTMVARTWNNRQTSA